MFRFLLKLGATILLVSSLYVGAEYCLLLASGDTFQASLGYALLGVALPMSGSLALYQIWNKEITKCIDSVAASL